MREHDISAPQKNSHVADSKNSIDDEISASSKEATPSKNAGDDESRPGKLNAQDAKSCQGTPEAGQASSEAAARVLVEDHSEGADASSADVSIKRTSDGSKESAPGSPGLKRSRLQSKRVLTKTHTSPALGGEGKDADNASRGSPPSSAKGSPRSPRKTPRQKISTPRAPEVDYRNDPKVRAILEVFDEEIGEDPEKLAEVFTTYCSEKTFDGEPLLNCVNLKDFFRDWEKAFPKKEAPSEQRIVSCYGSELQLQIDFCSRVKLSKAEASRGLCFDSFKVVLQSLISKYWHVSVAQEAFGMYSAEHRSTPR
jgi:hypothetical protein